MSNLHGNDPTRLLADLDFVRSLTRRLCADEHTAEDVAQDTMVTALEKPPAHGGNALALLPSMIPGAWHLVPESGHVYDLPVGPLTVELLPAPNWVSDRAARSAYAISMHEVQIPRRATANFDTSASHGAPLIIEMRFPSPGKGIDCDCKTKGSGSVLKGVARIGSSC